MQPRYLCTSMSDENLLEALQKDKKMASAFVEWVHGMVSGMDEHTKVMSTKKTHAPTEALLERFDRDIRDVYDSAFYDDTVDDSLVERIETLMSEIGCLRY